MIIIKNLTVLGLIGIVKPADIPLITEKNPFISNVDMHTIKSVLSVLNPWLVLLVSWAKLINFSTILTPSILSSLRLKKYKNSSRSLIKNRWKWLKSLKFRNTNKVKRHTNKVTEQLKTLKNKRNKNSKILTFKFSKYRLEIEEYKNNSHSDFDLYHL